MYKYRKIILIGDDRVGKTSIRNRYLREEFHENYLVTLGVEFTIRRKDGILTQIWDIGGQPSFKEIRKRYYAGTTDIIFVYDLGRPETLESYPSWIEEIHKNCSTQPSVIIVGNKSDIVTKEEMKVSRKQVTKYHHNLYFQLSAKYTESIDFLFDQVIAT